MTLRSRLHLNVRNVLQRLVSQHAMAYLHDKEGNDNMTEKKVSNEYCITVDDCNRRRQSIQGLHRRLLSEF